MPQTVIIASQPSLCHSCVLPLQLNSVYYYCIPGQNTFYCRSCVLFCKGCVKSSVYTSQERLRRCKRCYHGYNWCKQRSVCMECMFKECCGEYLCTECVCEVCLRKCVEEIFIPDLGGIVMGWCSF